MTRLDDAAETVTLEDAEVRLVGALLDGLDLLARLALAAEAATTEGVSLDDVQRPRLRLVLDEAAGMVALGAYQPDGSVRRLQGYDLGGVQARLRDLAAAGQTDATGPTQWH